MKSIEQIKIENPEVVEILESYNIWQKDGRNEYLVFNGSHDACLNYIQDSENDPSLSICPNNIVDQWENDFEGYGMITFGSGQKDDVRYSI